MTMHTCFMQAQPWVNTDNKKHPGGKTADKATHPQHCAQRRVLHLALTRALCRASLTHGTTGPGCHMHVRMVACLCLRVEHHNAYLTTISSGEAGAVWHRAAVQRHAVHLLTWGTSGPGGHRRSGYGPHGSPASARPTARAHVSTPVCLPAHITCYITAWVLKGKTLATNIRPLKRSKRVQSFSFVLTILIYM